MYITTRGAFGLKTLKMMLISLKSDMEIGFKLALLAKKQPNLCHICLVLSLCSTKCTTGTSRNNLVLQERVVTTI